MKVLFFVGINFRGFVKNYKFVDSCSLCATSRRILVQRNSVMVIKMIEFVHDHGPC
jgi:hypothetical protein